MKCIKDYEIKVMQSGAGYYIGTTEDGCPYCRLSADYYSTRAEAEQAMRELSFMPRVAAENIFCNGGAGCLKPFWCYEQLANEKSFRLREE